MKYFEGSARVAAAASDILTDEARRQFGIPDALYFVETCEDIQHVVSLARQRNKAITVLGAQTGITGAGAPADGTLAISCARMNRILRVRKDDEGPPVVSCQPGVTLTQIDAFLRSPHTGYTQVENSESLQPHAWLYPPDPTEMSAQLGGTVATNASGARSYYYGATRQHIDYVSVVFASGQTCTLHRGARKDPEDTLLRAVTDQGTRIQCARPAYTGPSVKNAAGYWAGNGMDMLDLFIGSEGTLGIMYEIGVRLSPRVDVLAGLSFLPGRAHAFAMADALRRQDRIMAIEYFDTSALGLMDTYTEDMPLRIPARPPDTHCALYWERMIGPDEDVWQAIRAMQPICERHGSSLAHTWSGSDRRRRSRLKDYRHAIPELVNFLIARRKATCPDIRKIGTDSAFPAASFAAAFDRCVTRIEKENIEHAIFGHLGDYHLHCNMLPSDTAQLHTALDIYTHLMDDAIRHGGTVSAEHGIGKLKKAYLRSMYGEEGMADMRRLKRVFDPRGILNPGNLFDLTE